MAAVISAGLLVASLLAGLLGPFGPLAGALLLAGWLALTAALGALALGWPLLHYRATSYAVSDRGILIRSGVLWRSVHFVPRNRIQHSDVSQGPLERVFELATLVLYTAGTDHASVSLGGLERATAFRIRDRLVDGGPDDAV